MKINKNIRLSLLFICVCISVNAQIGIGTSTPKGVLDLDSSIYGVVYPSVSLTASNVKSPVINPQGGALVVGTTVYNTNVTNTGSNDVEKGIYSWDGTKWVIHFFKRQSEIYKQTSSLRSSSILGFEGVPGLGPLNFKTFTATHSGLYKIEIKMYYGGGRMNSNGDVNTAMTQGDFRFTFNSTPHVINVKSFSTRNDNMVAASRDFENVWVETYKTIYLNLVANQTYDFSLEFDQYSDPGLVSSGSLGNGRGYVGEGAPCFIEFTYLDEQ